MKLLAFGEILYDVFGETKKIGGAPLNFCAHFSKLGGEGYILSAVGKDELGENALETASDMGVNTKYVLKGKHRTGICNVTYKDDEPVYDLSMICAYDNIMLTDEMLNEIKNEQFDILYFGTLAQRNEVSRRALERLTESRCFKKIFFDMNLRQDYFSREIIERSLLRADIVKINRSEYELLKSRGICKNEEDLCSIFGVEKLLLTLDKDGMVLYDADEKRFYNSSKPVNKVVSTVGAGDSSSACFLYNYLSEKPLQVCVERANIMGDYVVSFVEAIPDYSDELLKKIGG